MKTILARKTYGEGTKTAIYILRVLEAHKIYLIGLGSGLPPDSFKSGFSKNSYPRNLTNRIAKDSNALCRYRDPQICAPYPLCRVSTAMVYLKLTSQRSNIPGLTFDVGFRVSCTEISCAVMGTSQIACPWLHRCDNILQYFAVEIAGDAIGSETTWYRSSFWEPN